MIGFWDNQGHEFAKVRTIGGKYQLFCTSTDKILCESSDLEVVAREGNKLKWEHDNVE
jgi:hypothetical protein